MAKMVVILDFIIKNVVLFKIVLILFGYDAKNVLEMRISCVTIFLN